MNQLRLNREQKSKNESFLYFFTDASCDHGRRLKKKTKGKKKKRKLSVTRNTRRTAVRVLLFASGGKNFAVLMLCGLSCLFFLACFSPFSQACGARLSTASVSTQKDGIRVCHTRTVRRRVRTEKQHCHGGPHAAQRHEER